jgi:hypothetical protein
VLENSVWRQYHDTKSVHEVLVELYGCEPFNILNDEKILYASLKRRLTKKELRGFIMKEAGMDESMILAALHVNSEELEVILRKAYRKIRQDDMRNEVTALAKTLNT